MGCEIHVRTAGQPDRKLWVRHGQTVQFGRTELADCSIHQDAMMSRLHFAVDSEQGQCRIRDLSSRNGTYVNGEPINVRVLSNGDKILAGQTMFEVRIEESVPDDPLLNDERSEPATAPAEVAEASDTDAQRVHSFLEAIRQTGKMGSETILLDEIIKNSTEMTGIDELTLVADQKQVASHASAVANLASSTENGQSIGHIHGYSSLESGMRPIDMARLLVARSDFYLMINLRNMEQAAQIFFATAHPVKPFTFISESLVLLSHDDRVDLMEVFSRAWGRNAMIGLASPCSQAELAKRLQAENRPFVFPRTLLNELRQSKIDEIKGLMSQVDWVFVEDDDADQWVVLANPDHDIDWDSLGLSVPPQKLTVDD